jgi:hypothetical protein
MNITAGKQEILQLQIACLTNGTPKLTKIISQLTDNQYAIF